MTDTSQNSYEEETESPGFFVRIWPLTLLVVLIVALLARDYFAKQVHEAGLFASTDIERIALCMETTAKAMEIVRMESFPLLRAECAGPYKKTLPDEALVLSQAAFQGESPSQQLTLSFQNNGLDRVITDFQLTMNFLESAFVGEIAPDENPDEFQTSFKNLWIEPGKPFTFNIQLSAPYDFQQVRESSDANPFSWTISSVRGISFEIANGADKKGGENSQ